MQPLGTSKAADAFRTISEVAEDLDIPQHVLRFWETRFPSIRPLKRGGGRRYYRPDDVELLKGIRQLLYGQGYTIKGVQRILKEEGPRVVQDIGRGGMLPRAESPPAPEDDEPAAAPRPVRAERQDEPRPAPVRHDARPMPPGLATADLDRLRAALAELHECQRIIEGLKRR
ncbi:MerR family transcriptional regulator [Enterovirga sp.]|mgnify:CR=1 FL=1|uniref:MerR family transcriptional regulator n=1 Tax=Enterovirga sp. TaxID=2026350 RepID=UPI002C92E450|nr:MerR family transcriptional regulator [Enterovirga sp.]HMO30817.1 MerR family transcriptional regulator [Enterovirga sp.]